MTSSKTSAQKMARRPKYPKFLLSTIRSDAALLEQLEGSKGSVYYQKEFWCFAPKKNTKSIQEAEVINLNVLLNCLCAELPYTIYIRELGQPL